MVDGCRIRAARFRKSHLVELLRSWAKSNPGELENAIIVMDGPMGPGGPPTKNRRVDSLCASKCFHGWAQPIPIEHKSSKEFIGATYALRRAITPDDRAWTRGLRSKSGLTIVETNPTVALAVMMPWVSPDQIASRNRPKPFQGHTIRSKSDWYWRNGAGRQVAAALADGEADKKKLAEVTDHELCAALTCLALALQFDHAAKDESGAVPIGNHDGIYLLPARFHETWRPGLESKLAEHADFEALRPVCSPF